MHLRMSTTLGYILAWLLLSLLAVVLAFQWHSLILAAGQWIINTPALRPSGWSSTTLAGISSMAYLVLGAIILGVITFFEQEMRQAARDGRLTRQFLRYIAVMIAIWLFGFLLSLVVLYF